MALKETDPEGAAVTRNEAEGLSEREAEVRRIITTYTQIAPEVAEQMALPAFPQEVNVESMETVAELMQEYGITTEPADVDALLATD